MERPDPSREHPLGDPAWINAPCPFLPAVDRVYTAQDMEALGRDRGPLFYHTALHYAQSLWRTGFPAKSLLLVNRAFSAELRAGDSALRDRPWPYTVVAWLLLNRPAGQFIGNPRRHYQHLATRMVEPHKDLRTWRAWACWYLAKELLPESVYHGDAKQIREEGVIEPTRDEISRKLAALSPANDEQEWAATLKWCNAHRNPRLPGRHVITIRAVKPDKLESIQRLAREIWPRVYPGIISEAQIHYMLERFYDVGVMAAEIEKRAVCYALILVDQQEAGYLSFETLPGEKTAFLNKLYLLPSHHGIGAGAMALNWVEQQASRSGLRTVRLRVNRGNTTAIRAYMRAGYGFTGEICTDIGGGFVMDDYLMEKRL